MIYLQNLKHFRTLWQIIKPKPKSLYKYHSINRNLIRLLINNSLWAGSASNLNDPYDCDFEMSRDFFKTKFVDKLFSGDEYKSIPDTDKKWFLDGLSSAFTKDQMKTFQQFSRKFIGICCFSSKPDSELMWSHYADSGKGICLEFNFSTNDKIKKKLIPLRYSNKAILAKNDVDVSKALIKKRKAWSYENEWRLIEDVGLIPFKREELVRVIFGPKVHKECYKLVLKALAKNGYTPILSICVYTKNGLVIKEIMDTKKFLNNEN
jgi:hypothetical protein